MFKNILLASVFIVGLANAKPPCRELFPGVVTPAPAPTPLSRVYVDSFDDFLSDSEQGSVVYTAQPKPKSPKAFKRLEEAMSYNFIYQFAIDFEEEKKMSLEAVKRMKPGYLDMQMLIKKLETLAKHPFDEIIETSLYRPINEDVFA